jgi:hypothetical protein
MMHGAASLIAVAPKSRANKEAEQACIAICDLLLENVEIFRRVKRGGQTRRA